jgi:hypothetical protein
MSKYDPLTKRLAAAKGGEWKASFADLEKLLGGPLPKTARSGKTWWKADAATPQARAWAGWEVEPGKDGVVFRKAGGPAAAPPAPETKAIAPATSGDETPPILKRLEVSPGWGMALVAGGVAIVAGLGALAFRAVGRKKT